MIKIILIVVVVLVAALLALAASKPGTFRVRRSATIRARPETIFPLLNDFHNWSAWSPWEKLDPALERTFSGARSGKGAMYAWQGNRKVGAGNMEITQSSTPSAVTLKLNFLKPFEAHNVTEFTLVPAGDTTNLTWEMHGPSPFISKVMQVFMSMDDMIGKDFQAGLDNIKRVAEGNP
jgi:hypothetical protein